MKKINRLLLFIVSIISVLNSFSAVTAQNEGTSGVGDYSVSYRSEGDTLIIRNSRDIDTVDITAEKIWDDADNQDGIRPRTVKLQLKADGVNQGNAVTVSENENGKWSYTWKGLTANKGVGVPIKYTVEEASSPTGYSTSISKDGLTVTNKHDPEMREIEIQWSFEDDNNRDGVRPDTTVLSVMIGNDSITEVEFDNKDSSSKKVSVPKYTPGKVGELAEYSLGVKTLDPKYSSETVETDSPDILAMKGIYIPQRTSVNVTKEWDDNDNQDGKRPDAVTYVLTTDSVPGDSVTVTQAQSEKFEYTWSNLYKYHDKGIEYIYAVEELNTEDYKPTYDCTSGENGTVCVVTNHHDMEMFELPVTWIWNDHTNRDGKRQENVTVDVYADGVKVGTLTFKGSDPESTHTVTVPAYKPGEVGVPAEYTYDVIGLHEEYSDALNDSNRLAPVIIATYIPEKISLRVSKEWDDNDNRSGKRMASVKYALVTDGVEGESVTVSASTSASFSYVWNDLYKYHDQGIAYVYSVKELDSGIYEPTYECTERDFGYSCVVTNKLEVEMQDLTVIWNWDDEDNRDGVRPEEVTVNVFLDGEKVGTITYTGDKETSSETISVPAYKPGEVGVPAEFTYVVEGLPDSYTDTLDNSDPKAPEITAKYIPLRVSVKVSKIWDDSDNQDGKRMNSVTYALKADGVQQDPVTVTSDQSANFEYEWAGMYKFRDKGTRIVYEVVELDTGVYTPSYECTTGENDVTCVVTNKHEPETKELPVTWEWEDDDNRDGERPETVTVEVYSGCGLVGTITFSGSKNTETKVITVPAYTPCDEGVPAEYTYVVKDLDEEYTDKIDNTDPEKPVIIGEYTPKKVTVSVVKEWDDSDNQDGKRPETVTWQLMRDNAKEGDPVSRPLSDSAYTWSYLFKYHSQGVRYVYSVAEIDVPEGYQVSSTYETTEDNTAYTVTNTHNIEKIDVYPKIVWDDQDNQDGIRPGTLTIRIIADGVSTDHTFEADDSESWQHLFEELPKYSNGKEIDYSFEIVEEVDDYTYKFDENDKWVIIYHHRPEGTAFSANVKWVDDDNVDRVRPNSVTVQLYANGEPVGDMVIVSENEDWKTEWPELPKFENGEKIVYTVRQVTDLQPNYTTEYKDSESNTEITNYHKREAKDIPFIIIWDDYSNQDGKRPDSIDVILKTEDKVVGKKNEDTADDERKDSFTDVPKNEDGVPIKYNVGLESDPEHYTVTITVRPDGTTVITLKYVPEDFVRKSIDDENGKNWSNSACYAWQIVTIKLTAFNNGKNTLYNVTLRDYLPNDATLIKGSEALSDFDEEAGDIVGVHGTRVDANIAVLRPGETRVMSYKATAKNPRIFAGLPGYFDFGNESPLPSYAPNPIRETNTVDPCHDGPAPERPVSALPKTGFAPGVYTRLPQMKVNYQAYSQLRLRIPKLGVDAEILGVPRENGNYDVTWLGDNVGWLQDTAYPGSVKAGNSVLTGHLTNNYGYAGVFSGLTGLVYGDKIEVNAFGETFTYIVKDIATVYYDTPQVLSQDVNNPVLTLITCRYYNESTGEYDGRVVVTAILDSIS